MTSVFGQQSGKSCMKSITENLELLSCPSSLLPDWKPHASIYDEKPIEFLSPFFQKTENREIVMWDGNCEAAKGIVDSLKTRYMSSDVLSM